MDELLNNLKEYEAANPQPVKRELDVVSNDTAAEREATKKDYLRRKAIGRTTVDEDLAYRISSSADGDDLTSRVKVAIVEARASQLEDEKRRAELDRGESEEMMNEARSDAQGRYRKYRDEAWTQAMKELKEGKI